MSTDDTPRYGQRLSSGSTGESEDPAMAEFERQLGRFQEVQKLAANAPITPFQKLVTDLIGVFALLGFVTAIPLNIYLWFLVTGVR